MPFSTIPPSFVVSLIPSSHSMPTSEPLYSTSQLGGLETPIPLLVLSSNLSIAFSELLVRLTVPLLDLLTLPLTLLRFPTDDALPLEMPLSSPAACRFHSSFVHRLTQTKSGSAIQRPEDMLGKWDESVGRPVRGNEEEGEDVSALSTAAARSMMALNSAVNGSQACQPAVVSTCARMTERRWFALRTFAFCMSSCVSVLDAVKR